MSGVKTAVNPWVLSKFFDSVLAYLYMVAVASKLHFFPLQAVALQLRVANESIMKFYFC